MDGLLKLVLMFAQSAMPARQRASSSAALEIFAYSCFIVAIALALLAIGWAVAPRLGAAAALAIDAGLTAFIGLVAFALARRRSRRRASAPLGIPLEALLAQVLEHLKREKGLSIVAGLLVGVLAGGSRR